MGRRAASLLWFTLFGCDGADAQDGAADAAAAQTPTVAPLAALSSGACPDMSTSGQTTTFSSSGQERTVTVLFPSELPDDLGLLFFFHGVMSPLETPQPTDYMARALQLQRVADEMGMVIVLPQGPLWEMVGQEFFFWDAEQGTEDGDLALFDDLRTCAAEAFPVDLERVYAAGFSGGALFTTVVLGARADTLAAVVEMSGGSDLTIPLIENPVSAYSTPARQTPTLLVTGGTDDAWPSPQLALVNFFDASDVLEDKLVGDGHFVVRCDHDEGHVLTSPELAAMEMWLTNHRFGEPSPFASGLDPAMAEWCVESDAL
ncbi:MAG: PHB depolymerase family esterase [Myxococcota bacterium]